MANVALPDIGQAFDSSQVTFNLIAVGYSLGLAASVLYLGAVGDRYGRKLLLVLGTSLAVPMSLLAAYSPSDEVLFAARVGGGFAAGMAYPTTLALITALWSGRAADEVDRALVGDRRRDRRARPARRGRAPRGVLVGSVFLITLPLAGVALVMAFLFVPSHVNETTDPVDNLGGILSVVLVAALILGINFAPVPNEGALVLGLSAIALAAGVAFYIRQRRATNPLYDLDIAGRRIFWVAACAGIIVFGSLMGAAFVSQQFLQNVLGYSTLEAGASILPAVLMMVLVAPRSAKLVGAYGARFTLLAGYVFLLLAFLTMLLLWKEDISVLAGCARVRVHRYRSRARRHAGVALADRLGPRDPRRDGVRNSRPPARSRRRHHAVDIRSAADRRLRGRRVGGDRDLGQAHLRQRPEPAHEVVRGRGGCRASSTRSTRTRSRRLRGLRSSRAISGHTRQESSRSCSAPRSSSSSSRGRTRKRSYSRPTMPQTQRVKRRRSDPLPARQSRAPRRSG